MNAENNLAERLIAMVGRSQSDPSFQELLTQQMFNDIEYRESSRNSHVLLFRRLGVRFRYDKLHDWLIGLEIHVDPKWAEEDEQGLSPFAHPLPNGILPSDSRSNVASKLGSLPEHSSDSPRMHCPQCYHNDTWEDRYNFDPLEVSYVFASNTDRVVAIEVKYKPFDSAKFRESQDDDRAHYEPEPQKPGAYTDSEFIVTPPVDN